MKCQACNAPLSIEDEKCPYCGVPNHDAIRHRQEMKHFSGEFQKTRASVLRTTIENASKSMRIVILCIMITLFLFSVVFAVFSWDIAYQVRNWQSSANSKKYCAILDQYEEEGDFLSFIEFYNQHSLYSVDTYDKYHHIYSAASDYKSIYSYISRLLETEHGEEEYENSLEYLCEALEHHYEFMEAEPYSFLKETGAYDERHMDAVERVHEKIENLIQMTFSMTEEEMEEFRTFSTAGKQVFLERRFEANE